MKFLLLVLTVEVLSGVNCNRLRGGKFLYRVHEQHPGKAHYTKKPHSFPAVPFMAPFPKPLPRPHPFLVPPAPSVTSGYVFHTAHYPPNTAIAQLYHAPEMSGFKMKGYPRYGLSPVRQYIPHNYAPQTFGAVAPPKVVQMQAASYSTMSTMPYSSSSTPMRYHSWNDMDHNFDSDSVEFYKHSGNSEESEEDDDDEDDDDDGHDDDLSIDRKGTVVEAEKRKDDMSIPVHVLMSVVEAQNSHGDHHFSKKKGSEYADEHKSKKGYKTSKGHESEHKFNKGQKGYHDKEVHEKDSEEEGKKKSSHHDEKEDHGSHEEEDHGVKKGEFDEKKKYKKGQKSKGYHNVFHKDEYVKDHTFYDDLDQSGHYKKYEEEHKKHKKGNSKKKKGEHNDGSSKEGKKGHHGHYSKGHHDDADKVYEKKHDHEEHQGHNAHYKKKDGVAHKADHEYLKGY